eukprot:TRINITY_DN7469_c0_g3_i1.p1 TRINITY_DN7469_c0_g3~~TRINITY_DN7469_c0_g3_i1.p1  ORF type:complete len:297 (+),score=49.86 TRINITY_DN7469_c0_g3_i1:80-970(+)
MASIQNLLSLFDTVQGHLLVALPLAILTALFFELFSLSFAKFASDTAWWSRAKGPAASFFKNFGMNTSSDAALIDGFSWLVCICLHHVMCAMLLLPVLFMGFEAAGPWGQLAFFLGTCGDLGFDIYDFCKKFWMTFFPNHPLISSWSPCPRKFFFVVCVLHHGMAMTMLIPMNMKYSHLPEYHLIAVSLLGAAGICYACVLYKFTLDAKTQIGMLQCKGIVLMQFAVIVVTRVLAFFPAAFSLLTRFYDSQDSPFFFGGVIGAALMGLFNSILVVDATTALIKWMPRVMPSVSSSL